MKASVVSVVLCAALGSGGFFGHTRAKAASAQDYGLEDDRWNGLGYLLVTAKEANVTLTVPSELDFRRLGPGSVLFWVQPKRSLPTEDLLSFVRDGGHLILADDVGESAALMEALGIQRKWGVPPSHAQYYKDTDGIPVLTPSLEHFLFFNVETVVANYPASILGAGRPILTFDHTDEALVTERRWGGGSVLLISDASVFLNEMLRRFYGNKQFAANVMRFFCEKEACSVILALPATPHTGSYSVAFGRLGALPFLFDEAGTEFNRFLETVNALISESRWPGVFLLFVLLGLVVWMRRLLMIRLRAVAPPPLEVAVPGYSPFESYVRGLEAGQDEANFAFSAQIMIDEVQHLKSAPALHALLHDEKGRRRPHTHPGGDTLASQTRGALLRIEQDADNLRGADARIFDVDRLFELLADVKIVRNYLTTRPRSHSKRSAEPPKPS